MGSSAAAVRKAIRGLEEGLQVFTGQLASEAAELRRNVENQPLTGATYFRNILEELHQRLEGIAQELQALGAVSVDTISIEELVGHAVALYRQNHEQIQALEAALAKYGYSDLYAPLPPENPLDMLELTAAGRQAAGSGLFGGEADDYGAEAAAGGWQSPAADAGGSDMLGDMTNRLAAAHLSPGAGGGAGGAPPRTTLKAMAPMTAAKALMRADTPSSLASPDAMSPSMRELLGKYAASSSGGTQQMHLSVPPASACTPRSGGGGGGGTPPVPSYLSPAFQLAAMEQEVQMAHAEAAGSQHGGTPLPANSADAWDADGAVYNALTATAKKLAGKPSFLEAYKQRFPHVMASTERLLQTVEKRQRPAAAAVVAEEAAAGPVAALIAAAQQASMVLQQQQAAGGVPRQGGEEDSTLDLMSQVLFSRRTLPAEQSEDARGFAAASTSAQSVPAAEMAGEAVPAYLAASADLPSPPQMAQGGNGGTHSPERPGGSHLASQGYGSPLAVTVEAGKEADATGPQPLAPPQSARSRVQLEEAIAAALGRTASTSSAAAAPAPCTTAAMPPAVSATPAPAAVAAPPCMPAAGLASVSRLPAPPAAPPPATSMGNGGAAAAPAGVPPLRLVVSEEFASLPTFIKSQLPLDMLNTTLESVHAAAEQRGTCGFTMDDVSAAGVAASKAKVVVNSLVKLGRAQLKVLPQGATLYLLV